KEILAVVKKQKVLTVTELEKIFDYHTNAARRRLKRLVEQGKLDYVVIGGGGKASFIFKDFIDKRLYYLTEADLHRWIKKKMPKHIPSALKNSISQKLHDVGIDMQFKADKKKAIMITPKLYERIKENANKKGISIAEYVDKVT
ncbi:MAG: DeoR family transcriptional regulator, partial [Candidatus Aenigmarchaeota archaeon]|nr:DeoR family transcriptional regulator [Candidatus Aenigmarchaeota archaeon]